MNPVSRTDADALRKEAQSLAPKLLHLPRYDTADEQKFLILELAARAGCHEAVDFLGRLIPRTGHGHHVIREARKAIPKPIADRDIPLEHQLVMVKELALTAGCFGVLPYEVLGEPEITED